MTCRKGKAWLSQNNIEFEERDIVKEPLSYDELKDLAKHKGVSVVDLINPRSRNLKQLNVDLNILSEEDALKLLKENPKIMYRPILKDEDDLIIGFKEDNYIKRFI